MGKRPAASPGKPRKRGRRRKDEQMDEEEAEVAAQMRRKMILENNDEDEELMADIQEEGGHMMEDIYIPPKITRAEHPFTGQRLVIEKIVCENFKSYGGLKEMGPFHKSFSAIIGPNGNGKSNIIDAMLFVFGYRASKIRCKKVSTLIHKSELLPNVRSCAVTVHFVKIIDEGDKAQRDDYEIIENSRITVMRRAHADNSSVYYLDGRKVKFTDVAKFLKTNGIDIVHNRFLILQGEVEQIAQMPPISPNGHDTGLLEFLEEVIGTKRYIKPLAQLDERVEKYDYEREEKLQRVDLAEKEKANLTEPVKKAKEYLRDQNSRTRYQSMLYQKQALQSKIKMEEKEKVKIELEETVAKLQERLNKILEVNKERQQELAEAQKAFRTAEKEYTKVKKTLETADAQYIQLNQELQRTNETRKKLQKDAVKLEKDIEKLTGLPDSHKKDIEVLQKRRVELDEDIAKEEAHVKADLDRLNVKVEAALKEKEVTDKEFARLKTIRDEKKGILDRVQKELANYKEREAVEQKKLADLETELEKIKEAVKEKEKEGRTSMGNNRLEKMEENLHGVQNEVRRLSDVENQRKTVYEQARGDFQQAHESVEGNNELGAVDQAFLNAKADGMFPGLYGRIKNLAKIPEKYNIAATMATGVLEHWVADSGDTSRSCIEFLREKGLPPQTFQCMDRLGSYDRCMRERFDTPAQSHRVFDLLQISKPELAPVYYKAFRNTLVADDMDIATQVSFGGRQRHRVVTLKGEIVEPTGSMSGGGKARLEGKFNSRNAAVTVTRQQVAAMRQRCEEAQKEYQQAQEARQAAEAKARTLSEQIQDCKRKINNYNSDLAALRAQLPLKEANVTEQKKRVKGAATVPQVLKEKEKLLAKSTAEHQASIEPCQEAEENAAKLAGKVQELQVTKKKEITMKLDKMTDMRKKVEEELNRKIVELKNCETNRKKSETKLQNVRKEIEKLQQIMEEKNERRKELQEKGKEIKDKEQELDGKVKETQKQYEELKNRSNEFQQEENKLTKEKLTLDNKLNDVDGEVKACKQMYKQSTEAVKNLVIKEIPEEETEPLKVLTDEEIQAISATDLERKVQKYNQKLKREVPNLNILEDYRSKVNILYERIKELEEVTKQRDAFRETYCRLDQQRATEFMEGFALISSRLKEMFRMISMGGDAELEVVDILDLFGCGVQFSVRPARKTWKKISNLSGGEKTLASLSLVFALHHFKPSPFYVMDEIDAALDFKNVSIIANYIKDRTKFTQFIIISLRSNMFELADSLLGVYKIDNMSYSIHIGVKRLIQELKTKYSSGGQACPLTEAQTQEAKAADTKRDQAKEGDEGVRKPNGFPDPNLSEIVNEGDGTIDENVIPESPVTIMENSQSQNGTVIEGDANTLHENTLTKTAESQKSSGALAAETKEVEAGSEDLFEDMEVDNDDIQSLVLASSIPGPFATSTPFVPAKRTGKAVRTSETLPGDATEETEKSQEEELERELSPIKNDPDGNDSNESFKTAETSQDDDQSLDQETVDDSQSQ